MLEEGESSLGDAAVSKGMVTSLTNILRLLPFKPQKSIFLEQIFWKNSK
jgi:hypothetical protein